MEAQIASCIRQQRLLGAGDRVLVGVSGGVDSVVLLHVLQKLGYAVEAAHVNYGLRAEAEADEAHVRLLCKKCEVPLWAKRCNAKAEAEQKKTSVQEAARDLRYLFFAETAARRGIGHVAVAHHLDDQAETLLLNLFRGAGPEGLAGMAPARRLSAASDVLLVRPLLATRRAAIEAYARAEELTWREDASNHSPEYRRGALRSEIMPLVEAYFGTATPERIARTADLLRAYLDKGFHHHLAFHFEQAARSTSEGGGRLDLAYLERLPTVWQDRLLLEALKRWLPGAPRRADFAAEVRGLVGKQTGRRVESKAGVIWRERTALLFKPRSEKEKQGRAWPHMLAEGETVKLPQGRLTARYAPVPERHKSGTPNTVHIDADRLRFPLAVRPWQPGDRLRPLGLDGSKKVSDLLTEAKVATHRRQEVLVVLSAGEIVWVVGHRLSRDVRLRDATRRVVQLAFDAEPRPES